MERRLLATLCLGRRFLFLSVLQDYLLSMMKEISLISEEKGGSTTLEGEAELRICTGIN